MNGEILTGCKHVGQEKKDEAVCALITNQLLYEAEEAFMYLEYAGGGGGECILFFKKLKCEKNYSAIRRFKTT